MTISLMAEVAWCLCATLLVSLPARAQSGRITFSGAVVEPSCSAVTEENLMALADPSPARGGQTRRTCARPGNTAGAASRIYALTIVRLSSSVPDRVLQYFDAYVKADRAGAADPLLLTQTYE